MEIEGKGWWIIEGGQRVCWPPSQIIGVGAWPPPLPTPMMIMTYWEEMSLNGMGLPYYVYLKIESAV